MDAIPFFIYLCVSLYQEFFLRNRLREFVSAIIASIMSKFEQILWERFRNILKWSFKRHKNSDIACYPDNYLIFYENDKLWKRGFILWWFYSIEDCVQEKRGIIPSLGDTGKTFATVSPDPSDRPWISEDARLIRETTKEANLVSFLCHHLKLIVRRNERIMGQREKRLV